MNQLVNLGALGAVKYKPKSLFLAFLLVFNLIYFETTAFATTASEQLPSQPEMNNIQKVLDHVVDSINSKDSKNLIAQFSTNFVLITLENKKVTPLPTFLEYWDSLFKGDKATIKKIHIEIQIDPEPIYIDNKIAIVQGTANEEFLYYKGDDQVLHTRWTIVLEKKSPKQTEWKISAIHHSSGITKSMLNKLQSQLFKTTLGGLIVGLVLGILMVSLSRKTKNR